MAAFSAAVLSRVLLLTLLAPNIIVALLDERQEREVAMGRRLEPFPVEWEGHYCRTHA